jgi:dienelactone hydrolase
VQRDGYRLVKISYEVEPGERVSAYLLIPDGVDSARPAPAVAVWHQHRGEWHIGKSEPAGLAGDPMHHTGAALARGGFVVLCPDALCFEDRRDPALADGRYEQFQFLRYVVQGKSLAWKNILDMQRAIDLLVSRPEVRADRIGCYGHSMGSTFTWLVGPWEPRIRCLVGNCCMPTYTAIERHRLIHCFTNFIPGWQRFGDTPNIVALIAPRPLHLNFGDEDADSPMDGVRPGLETIQAAYAEAGCPENFSSYIERGAGHVLSDAMWRRTRDWFVGHLLV